MSNPAGFFRVEKREDRWWLIGPDHKRFISAGVDTVKREADHGCVELPGSYPKTVDRKCGSLDAWREAAAGLGLQHPWLLERRGPGARRCL
jgi:hypothetical protein